MSLGKFVLVLWEIMERLEVVMVGIVKFVGINISNIVVIVAELLSDDVKYKKMVMVINFFGDGYVLERIFKIVWVYFS